MITVFLLVAVAVLVGAIVDRVVRAGPRQLPHPPEAPEESRLTTVATATRLLTEKDEEPPAMDPPLAVALAAAVIPVPSSRERTAKSGDSLTDAEIKFLVALHKAGLPDCIDCQVGFLCEGPSGGFSTNYRCNNKGCYSIFNIGLPFAERVTDASPNASRAKLEEGPYR